MWSHDVSGLGLCPIASGLVHVISQSHIVYHPPLHPSTTPLHPPTLNHTPLPPSLSTVASFLDDHFCLHNTACLRQSDPGEISGHTFNEVTSHGHPHLTWVTPTSHGPHPPHVGHTQLTWTTPTSHGPTHLPLQLPPP